ncbi:ECF transporter S component [Clostridium aestuarii]|uniref:ECF transporter S component n=1 Tax=Clostridium aestuarii TaxID=338193 RepID=A0ABT4CXZ4_9CLOT|nr:ECF transporter S component [Clostridium aestuarii]MCY6483872.1 ECF transporter S component [Clostridium aestuarii]
MRNNNNVKKLVQSSILLAFAVILQLIGRNFVQINPLLIGPLISTIILLTTYICGLNYGILISILIPMSAIPLGALASPLIPFAPFIVIGNIVFAAGFAIVMKKGRSGLYLGVLLGTFVKVLFLSFSATKLIYMFKLGLSPQSAKMIGMAFTTPQIIISLLGGAVAIIVIELLKRRKITNINII